MEPRTTRMAATAPRRDFIGREALPLSQVFMGNRVVTTTPEQKIGLCLHRNGGSDTVEPLLRYCELKGYRALGADTYGWACLPQVVSRYDHGGD